MSLLAIDLYRRHVSPRKGFACAYRVAHGGASCSAFARQRIARVGAFRAVRPIRQRFADCREAARELAAQTGAAQRADQDPANRRRRGGGWSACSTACDVTECGLFGVTRGCGKADNCDCSPDCCSL
ncbi:MAG: membrane protein insertion efficiency factor YidD [Pseudomonadota bacterium]